VIPKLVLYKRVSMVFKNLAKSLPVEFVMIGLMVAVHKDRMGGAQLAAVVGEMRTDVRNLHVDIGFER
jgi:hypothetical protein